MPLLFEIRDPSSAPRAAEGLVSAYQGKLRAREEAFLAGIGPSGGREKFRAFVFLRDCLVTERMRLGRCEVRPAGGLGTQDQTAFLNAFLERLGANGRIEDESSEAASLSHPCAVVYFPIVRADSPSEATNIAVGEAGLISDALGAFRWSYGSIFAVVVVDTKGTLSIARDVPRYRGNLAGGFISGEDPGVLRNALVLIRTDPRRALYLGLLREALREDRWEFAVFRFWNILETVARNKNYQGRPLTSWAGEPIFDKKGRPRTVLHVKELVVELLKEHFGQGASPPDWGGRLQQGSFPEMATIWYQRRNCVAHTGACQPNNPAVCRADKADCVSCNRAREEVVASAADGTGFGDGYLEALRQTVIHVVRSECS